MSRHLEKILAHAERELAVTEAKKPTDALPIYRRFLKIEEHRLRLRHRAGDGGREVCARRVDLVDVLLRHVLGAATRTVNETKNPPLALVALGGYGRRELNPHSDVDVMFLHREKAVSAATTQIVEQVLYFLWDIGFKVGHSTRTVREAVAAANSDMNTKTAMLESRFVAGERALEEKFREQFRVKCVAGFEREYIEMRMRDQQARHAKFGNSVYLQEPNLKNGCGGLRDYQNLLWMTFFKAGSLTTTRLVGKDWLSEPDQRRIDAAYDFLLRLRTDLHYLNGRAIDVLHLNMQEAMARQLGYPQTRGLLSSEALMKDLLGHARNIFHVTERITAQFASGYSSAKTRSLFSFLPRARRSLERVDSFVIQNRQIDVSQRDLFEKNPTKMMEAIELAQVRELEPAPELSDLFSRQLGKVTLPFRYGTEPRKIFRAILSRKGRVGRALRLMHRLDLLGQYIPEFGQLTCLVQHEFFHRYTADEHTLLCIDKLDALVTTENPKLLQYRELFAQMNDPFVLYLALLLHDTGKAVGARPHSEASAVFAQRVARRLQLSPDERKMLILLVDHHVTLSNIAQRRNIDDPATVSEFAAIMKNQKNLDALMLLTLADGQGTSDTGWSDWKEMLVWQLYRATSQYLVDRQAFQTRAEKAREKREASVKEHLGADYEDDEIEAHFEAMPDNYFRAFDAAEIVGQVKLVHRFYERTVCGNEPLVPVVNWEPAPEKGHSVLSICTWDRQQLLSRIAGSISLTPLNILSADIYTRADNVALDIFRVSDLKGRAVTNAEDVAAFETILKRVLAGDDSDLAASLKEARQNQRPRANELKLPARLTIDNQSDPLYTLVEIQFADRIGLLHDLVECFSRSKIDIALSRISTENGAATDTFYVTDRETHGKIVAPARLTQLQNELERIAEAGR